MPHWCCVLLLPTVISGGWIDGCRQQILALPGDGYEHLGASHGTKVAALMPLITPHLLPAIPFGP